MSLTVLVSKDAAAMGSCRLTESADLGDGFRLSESKGILWKQGAGTGTSGNNDGVFNPKAARACIVLVLMGLRRFSSRVC
jgi:hypothetical protein